MRSEVSQAEKYKYVLTHVCNLRNLAEDHGGKEEKNSYTEGGSPIRDS